MGYYDVNLLNSDTHGPTGHFFGFNVPVGGIVHSMS